MIIACITQLFIATGSRSCGINNLSTERRGLIVTAKNMSFVMGAREPGRKMKKLHTLPEYTLLEKRACEQRSSANSSQEVKKRQALSLFSAERKKALRQISMDVCVGVYVLLC